MISYSDWLSIIGIAASPVTGIVGFFFGLAAKRPRIVHGGGGSGGRKFGSRDVVVTTLSFHNLPRFWGRPITREAAKITGALIYDPDLQEYVGQALQWHGPDGKPAHACTIDSGESCMLDAFAKQPFSDEYFVCFPNELESNQPRPSARYTEKKKRFQIVPHDNSGYRYRFNIDVRNKDHAVEVRIIQNWGERIWRFLARR